MQLLWRHHARVRSTQLTGSHTLDPLHIPGEIASTTTGEIKEHLAKSAGRVRLAVLHGPCIGHSSGKVGDGCLSVD